MKIHTRIFLLVICCVLMVNCSSDKYEYPPVYRELVDLNLSDEKVVESVILSDNKVCFPENGNIKLEFQGVELLDNRVRVLTHLEFLEKNVVKLYGFAYIPVLIPQTHVNFVDDGSILKTIRCWDSNGKYINVEIQVPKLDRIDRDFSVDEGIQILSSPTHIVGANIKSLSANQLSLELLHRGDLDSETGNKESLILSIDISLFKENDKPLSVILDIKQRDKKSFTYKTEF